MTNNVGRKIIYTPYKEITKDNIIPILQKAFNVFKSNADDCQYLIDYESGDQPLQRKESKKVMTWVDFECVDGIPTEVTDFWVGFGWGNPITLVQRGDSKNGEEAARGIAELNANYALTGNARDLQTLAHYVEICGIGYTLVEINNEWESDEDSYFTRDVLDPRCAFVVRSSYYSDHRVMIGVTFRMDDDETIFITAYTKDYRYELKAKKKEKQERTYNKTDATNTYISNYDWSEIEEDGQPNYLKRVPVVEWIRAVDRTGVFEKQIPAIDNLNLVLSDISNGIDQGIQAFFWTNDVELDEVEVENEDGTKTTVTVKPGPGDWLHTYTGQNGTQPKIQPLVLDYHLDEMRNNYLSQRALILQKCHVPQRNNDSGGSTGVAMDSASGWSDAENIASAQECITLECQMDEVAVVLAAIRESTDVPNDSPMKILKKSDIEPCVRRPKSDVTTKTNAFCALIAKGASVEDALAVAPIAPDPAQFIARSGEGIRKYQETAVWSEEEEETADNEDEEKRPFADNSDQITNSPLIDGMTTGQEVEIEETE